MFLHPLKSTAGFTYLAALMIVVIMGIMMGVAGQSWKMIMDREREEELLWAGTQYRDAMIRWYKPRPGQHVATPLRDLKDLLKDPRSLQNVRYLRRLYPDPITGENWVPIKDANQGIVGVASSSEKEPIKQANFPKDFIDFEGKKKYSDWQFIWNKVPAPRGTKTTITGLPTPPGKPSP
ncbi:type II secretion system protein [Geotalea sp. SG265]|uniref:type II secretion system protein n=1 Tax=Geotalea sp. SG265 TaxID=2922867 RepID=UPI001FAF7B9B|nr:type II secretion system protein [Geotalea sp. SG265]